MKSLKEDVIQALITKDEDEHDHKYYLKKVLENISKNVIVLSLHHDKNVELLSSVIGKPLVLHQNTENETCSLATAIWTMLSEDRQTLYNKDMFIKNYVERHQNRSHKPTPVKVSHSDSADNEIFASNSTDSEQTKREDNECVDSNAPEKRHSDSANELSVSVVNGDQKTNTYEDTDHDSPNKTTCAPARTPAAADATVELSAATTPDVSAIQAADDLSAVTTVPAKNATEEVIELSDTESMEDCKYRIGTFSCSKERLGMSLTRHQVSDVVAQSHADKLGIKSGDFLYRVPDQFKSKDDGKVTFTKHLVPFTGDDVNAWKDTDLYVPLKIIICAAADTDSSDDDDDDDDSESTRFSHASLERKPKGAAGGKTKSAANDRLGDILEMSDGLAAEILGTTDSIEEGLNDALGMSEGTAEGFTDNEGLSDESADGLAVMQDTFEGIEDPQYDSEDSQPRKKKTKKTRSEGIEEGLNDALGQVKHGSPGPSVSSQHESEDNQRHKSADTQSARDIEIEANEDPQYDYSQDSQPRKKKTKKTRKPQTLKDMFDGLVQGVCTPYNNDVFQQQLRLPTLSLYPFDTDRFEVVQIKNTSTCIIDLGKTQTVEHKNDTNRTVVLGLDLSFEERQLLYNCLDDTARLPHREEYERCYVTLKELYKDVAVLILGNKEYVARYSALAYLCLLHWRSSDNEPFWGHDLRKYKNKDNSHQLMNIPPISTKKAPFYHKFATKKTSIGTVYYCHLCDKPITTTPLKHFTDNHQGNDMKAMSNIPGTEMYCGLLNVINKKELMPKSYTSYDEKVTFHANRAIRLSMKHVNLNPSATNFFHHGEDACKKELDAYFHTMKGHTLGQLDKNKGEKQTSIEETGEKRTQFFQKVHDEIQEKLLQYLNYPWNVLYSNLDYSSSLIDDNKDHNVQVGTSCDVRSELMYGIIIGCVHGTYDESTHPVLKFGPYSNNFLDNLDRESCTVFNTLQPSP